MRSMMTSSSAGLTPARRLVEQDDLAARPSARGRAPAACAGRRRGRAPARPRARESVDEVEQRQRASRHARAPRRATRPRREPVRQDALAGLALRAEQDVLEHRHPGERARDLEGAAEAAGDARLRRLARRRRAPSSRIAPRVGRRLPAMQVEHRRLAGAVRADQPDDLAARDARATRRRRRRCRRSASRPRRDFEQGRSDGRAHSQPALCLNLLLAPDQWLADATATSMPDELDRAMRRTTASSSTT